MAGLIRVQPDAELDQVVEILERDGAPRGGVWPVPAAPPPPPPVVSGVCGAGAPPPADNGAPLVTPGSHNGDDERPPLAEEAIPTEMAPGSGLIWLGGVYHGGGK